jgi:hypothetical protein
MAAKRLTKRFSISSKPLSPEPPVLVSEAPSSEIVHLAGGYEVFDGNGNVTRFSTFFDNKQVLVVFIRHFMCGFCLVKSTSLFRWLTVKQYVTGLSTEIPPSELSAKNLDLVIIGCGDPSLIKFYARETETKYPIYGDPSQNLFKIFELEKTMSAGKQPEYDKLGWWGALKHFMSVLRIAGVSPKKAGDPMQVGGE